MKLDFTTDSRYHRQELITWWDQSKLTRGKVLVVGAGALGNEVVKNLALVGVGSITVVDMDTIEHSNLARCVFFRDGDEGEKKANVLARRAKELNPEIEATAETVPVQRLGIAYLEKFDLVIGALDNREARAWVNQAVRKLGGYWIDGAIEGLRGVARTFGPEGACYECTLSEADFKMMSHRRSCALLAPEEILAGKTPTNATTASVIAGVQVQEAIKLLVGEIDLLALVGKCWVYTGDTMTSYVTNYAVDEYCNAHDRYELLLNAHGASTLQDLVADFSAKTEDSPVAIDFEEDLITLMACASCGDATTQKSRVRSSLGLGEGLCPSCGSEIAGSIRNAIEIDDPLVREVFENFQFAREEIVTIRGASSRAHYRLKREKND